MAADATFHLAVVAASHNDVMTAIYADLGEVLRDWLREDVGDGADARRRTWTTPGWSTRSARATRRRPPPRRPATPSRCRSAGRLSGATLAGG